MFKNIQFKIILVFFIIGILIISGLGIFFLNATNTLEMRNRKWTSRKSRTSRTQYQSNTY